MGIFAANRHGSLDRMRISGAETLHDDTADADDISRLLQEGNRLVASKSW